jgi:hypothetical protein
MVSTYTSYQLIAKNLTRSLALKGAERVVAHENEYYLKNIGSVKSADDLLKNTRLFKYAMNAFGLGDLDYAKGMMRKVLSEDVADKKSFVNRIADDRFVAFAKVFNFKQNGESTTSSAAARQGVVDAYVRQALETSAGAENEGVRLALYFQRTAPTVKSAFGLLGDPALWKVVKTVFDFPDAMATADIDKQAAAVTGRLNLADLKDPDKLQRFIQRFTSMYDVTDNATPDPLLSLFDTSSSAQTGFSDSLIATLHSLKQGGF